MSKIRRVLGRFCSAQRTLHNDDRGLSTVEYVIILVVIAVLAIGVWRTFGSTVMAKVGYSTGQIEQLNTGDTGSNSSTGTSNSKAGTP